MIPDYKNYTIEQLIDVRDHVDKTQYPETYDVIINELANRNVREKQIIKDIDKNLDTKKIETQFGLVVFRLPVVSLILLKIAATITLILFGIKFYEGFILQEVTVRGDLLSLSDSPIGYYIRMLLYGVLSLNSIWIISFGSKLKQ